MINLMNGNQTFESLQRQGFVDELGRPIRIGSQDIGQDNDERIEIQSTRSMMWERTWHEINPNWVRYEWTRLKMNW